MTPGHQAMDEAFPRTPVAPSGMGEQSKAPWGGAVASAPQSLCVIDWPHLASSVGAISWNVVLVNLSASGRPAQPHTPCQTPKGRRNDATLTGEQRRRDWDTENLRMPVPAREAQTS
jgi:hypothetical protein